MPRHIHEFTLDIDRDRLFRALADLKRWPEWDDDIRAVEHEGAPSAGTRFTLHLKDGSAVALTVEAIEPPSTFVDQAKLPLARMVSRHELLPAEGGGTRLRHVSPSPARWPGSGTGWWPARSSKACPARRSEWPLMHAVCCPLP
jgi:hypothetical protein